MLISVAHVDDDERALVLGVVLDQFLAWVRTLSGNSDCGGAHTCNLVGIGAYSGGYWR